MTTTFKGLRTWQTHDGGGYQGTLVVDGVAAAYVHDDGHGGCLTIEVGTTDAAKRAWDTFRAWALARPLDATLFPDSLPDDDFGTTSRIEIAIGACLEDFEWARRVARLSKTKTLFRLPDDRPGEWRTLMLPDSDESRALVSKKYSGLATFAR